MKIIGIHQINYFPWIGYFNKMAKSDLFVYLDCVQLTDRGVTNRVKVITSTGQETFITVGINKKGHREKQFKDIEINENSDWQVSQKNFIIGNYSKHKYFDEIMEYVDVIFSNKYNRLMDVNMDSINIARKLLNIKTPTILQSELNYNKDNKKNDLMLALTKAAGGDVYLSGMGAKKYMEVERFSEENVKVKFQTFCPFEYEQRNVKDFVPGLSILDMFFNLGIKKSELIFWENMQNDETFEC